MAAQIKSRRPKNVNGNVGARQRTNGSWEWHESLADGRRLNGYGKTQMEATARCLAKVQQARRLPRETQVTPAKETGVGLATIRRIEQNEVEPRLSPVRKLTSALGVSGELLVFGLEAISEKPPEEEPR
jgi:DNA-binding XRE family transcriptional regulator